MRARNNIILAFLGAFILVCLIVPSVSLLGNNTKKHRQDVLAFARCVCERVNARPLISVYENTESHRYDIECLGADDLIHVPIGIISTICGKEGEIK